MDKSILVVDDEPQILSALKRTLRNQNYSVLFANDGNEALDILKQHEVALILSDYMMPGLSGTELLTQAEKIQPKSIRIILSGHSDFQTVLQSIKEGIVHKFLAKPWTNDVLIEQINKALETGVYPEDNKKSVTAPVKKESSEANVFNQTYEMVLSKENKITSIAPELAELFEYSEREICGEDFSILFSEKSYQQHLSFVSEQKIELENSKVSMKKRIAKTQHNSFFSIELAMTLKQDETICAVTPIQGLTPKGKGLDSILESIQGPYLLIDKLGKIRKFNQQLIDLYADFYEPSKGELLEEFIKNCIEKGAFPESEQNIEKWFEQFSQFDDEVNEHLLKTDEWLKIKATRAPEGAKILLHFDISKKRKMQLSLKNALVEAELAKQEKAEVIENVYKNVALPMKDQVLEPLERLKNTDLSEIQKDYIDNVMESGSKILSNINHITKLKD